MKKKIVKKSTSSKKSDAPAAGEGVIGYNVKQKAKVLMDNVVIDCNNNRYIAKGVAANAHDQNMAAIMGKDAAEEAIKKGWATKGEGWPKK